MGVASSIAFIPRGSERALLELETGHTEKAVAALEMRYKAGDHSPATVGALAEARARIGDVEGATTVLRELLGKRPNDVVLLQVLANLSKSLQNWGEQAELLERLRAIQPSASVVRNLVEIYGKLGRREQERQALRALIIGGAAYASEFVRLASLEADLGMAEQGADVLEELDRRHPGQVDASILALEMSLRLRAGKAEIAVERGRRWLSRQTEQATAVLPLASVLSAHGQPGRAVQLLMPFARDGVGDAVILALARAEIDSGRREAALERLDRAVIGRRRYEHSDLARLRLELAISVNDVQRVLAVVKSDGISAVPLHILAGVARAAANARDAGVLRAIMDDLGERDLSSDALSTAEIYLALADWAKAAFWLGRINEADTIIISRAIRIAHVELRLGRHDRAAAALRKSMPIQVRGQAVEVLAEYSHASDQFLPEATRLFVRLSRAEEAARIMDWIRRRRASAEAEWAWALAATGAGDGAGVVAWLKQGGILTASPELLRELVLLAWRNRLDSVAAIGAARLVEIRGNDADRMLLAEIRAVTQRPWLNRGSATPSIIVAQSPNDCFSSLKTDIPAGGCSFSGK
jgi:tetratricopeptide (TPR) repeat protein